MIRSIHIKNFKAIKEIMLDDLSHINYLVGPNGSGKSSILQCIQYIRAAKLIHEKDKFIILDCLTENNRDQILSFFHDNFEFNLTQSWVKDNGKYVDAPVQIRISGRPKKSGNTLIFHYEAFQMGKDKKKQEHSFIDFFYKNYATIYIDTHNTSFETRILERPQEYLSLTGNARTEKELDGSILEVNEVIKDVFNQKYRIAKECGKYFMFSEVNGEDIKQEIYISELSAGIRLFALIKRYIRMHMEKHSLMIFIEEPETSLHPGVQKRFPQMLEELIKDELAKDKSKLQIFVTTHSPFIISGTKDKEIKSLKIRGINLNQKCYTIKEGILDRGDGAKNLVFDSANLLGASISDFLPKMNSEDSRKQSASKIIIIFLEGVDDCEAIQNALSTKDEYIIVIPAGSAKSVIQITAAFSGVVKEVLSLKNFNQVVCFGIIDRSSKDGINIKGEVHKTNGTNILQDSVRNSCMEEYPNVYMWQRREIENYIYDPMIIAEAYPDLDRTYKEWLTQNKIDICISEVKDKINCFVNHTQIKRENLLNTNSFRQLIFSELSQFLKELEGGSYIDRVIQ